MNTKMKVLSLALVGLCGYAGSALAVCPNGPAIADGGAWSSSAVLPPSTSSLVINSPGLDATECKLQASLGPTITAQAIVRDDTPNAEPRYRFQFLVDPSALGTFSASDNVVIFQTPGTTSANGNSRALRVLLVGGPAGSKRVRFQVSCDTGPTFLCSQTFATDLTAGANRIEGDLVLGVTGSFKAWVNAASGTTEPAASVTIPSGNTSAFGGVDAAQLGLVAPSAAYKNNHATQVSGFDAFDSRRSTYIGS